MNNTTTLETDLNELKAYFGLMVVMGVNRPPELRVYWRTDPKLNSTFISQISRKRFEEIERYLHFTDNSILPLRDEPGYHRLQKVMPFIKAMKRLTHTHTGSMRVSVTLSMHTLL